MGGSEKIKFNEFSSVRGHKFGRRLRMNGDWGRLKVTFQGNENFCSCCWHIVAKLLYDKFVICEVFKQKNETNNTKKLSLTQALRFMTAVNKVRFEFYAKLWDLTTVLLEEC